MRLFTKRVLNCKNCPNVRYIHFNGEGTDCPWSYDHPYCVGAKGKKIPDRNRVPEFCPLSVVDDGVVEESNEEEERDQEFLSQRWREFKKTSLETRNPVATGTCEQIHKGGD